MAESVRTQPRILVAIFHREEQLRWAISRLLSIGLEADFIGASVTGDGAHSRNLLSVVVPLGRHQEIVFLLQDSGALIVGEPKEIMALYGPIPHPGAYEDRDLKMYFGREYPATLNPPPLAPERVPMRTLDPKDRVRHFDEVEVGYTSEEALVEASRCLQCPVPSCVEGCPAHNNIPGFIRTVVDGDYERGIEILRQTSNFPGVCGRVCNKAKQCEGACIIAKEGGPPIAIGALERFLADRELDEDRRQRQALAKAPPTGKWVAVIGSGPSGLAAAEDLALMGHQVTVYESLPVIGGALAWGIPTFRLPSRTLEEEIRYLNSLGVEFRLNTKVGLDITVDDLMGRGHDAVFVGAGTTLAMSIGAPGEELEGVYTASEFLSRAKLARLGLGALYQPPAVGRKLAVIGAGNTAMDVAQTALRLGAEEVATDVAETAVRLGVEEVTVVYRRSEAEMPARPEEVHSAREEGVRFRFLTSPVRFIGDEKGKLAAMECTEMELGLPDRTGRRSPVPKRGSNFLIPVDTVVAALGYRPDASVVQGVDQMKTDGQGLVVVDRLTGRTDKAGIWAGGDIVSGPDTVVRGMVAGKKAAKDIDLYLRNKGG